MSIKRIFVNSYLAYTDDAGESLTKFIVDFPEAINNPKDVSLMSASLAFYPRYPNFTPDENKIYMTVETEEPATYNITITLPANLVYAGPTTDGRPGVYVEDELNNPDNIVSDPPLPASFAVDIGEFIYDKSRQQFGLDIVGSVEDVTMNSGPNTAYRRIGLSKDMIDEVQEGSFLFGNAPFLARTQVVYLCSNISNDSMVNAKNTGFGSNIMTQLPVTDPANGSLLPFIQPYNWGKLAYPRSFQSVEFIILDDQFKPILFTSNANLLLAFEITYEKEQDESQGVMSMPNTKRPFFS